MSFRRARTPMRRQYQRVAIARSQARKWRPAEQSDLTCFVATVNEGFAGRSRVDWEVRVNARRRSVLLESPAGEYRATLRAGSLLEAGGTFQPITVDQIERFEFRRVLA